MKFVPVNQLKNGQLTAQDVECPAGKLLLRRGTVLDEEYISYLKEQEVKVIAVIDNQMRREMNEDERKKYRKQVKPRKVEIFKNCHNDFLLRDLLEAIIDVEAEKRWAGDE